MKNIFNNSKIPKETIDKISEELDSKNQIKNSVELFKASIYEVEDESEIENKEESKKETYIDIDMLRTGKFLRNYFGLFTKLLTIDEQMIDKMIKNFNDKIIPEDIQLDTEHRMEESYGWLKSLKKTFKEVKGVNQCFLVGTWKLNKSGKKLIEDEIYKHFSIEFRHNYSPHEVFETIKEPDGTEKPSGPVMYYGPTITGGALTNRPFIPNMKALEANEFFNKNSNLSDQLIEISDVQELNSSQSDDVMLNSNENNIKNKPVFSLFKNIKSANKVETKEKKGNNMNLKNSHVVLEVLKENFAKLEDKTSPEAIELSKKISDFESEILKAQTEIEALASHNLKISEDLKNTTVRFVQLENQVQSLTSEMLLSKERARQSEIESYCINMLSMKNVTKPFADKVKEYLTADSGGCIFKVEDKEYKLRDIIDGLIMSLPKAAFVPTGTKLDLNADIDRTETNHDRDDFNKEKSGDEDSKYDEALSKAANKLSSKNNAGDKASVVVRPQADNIKSSK